MCGGGITDTFAKTSLDTATMTFEQVQENT